MVRVVLISILASLHATSSYRQSDAKSSNRQTSEIAINVQSQIAINETTTQWLTRFDESETTTQPSKSQPEADPYCSGSGLKTSGFVAGFGKKSKPYCVCTRYNTHCRCRKKVWAGDVPSLGKCGKTAQSKRGLADADWESFLAAHPQAQTQLMQMLEREEQFAHDWVPFYHSQNGLLYDVNAVAAAISDLEFDFKGWMQGEEALQPLPRFLTPSLVIDAASAGKTCADHLMEKIGELMLYFKDTMDHEPFYSEAALSVNTGLLAPGDEISPVDALEGKRYDLSPPNFFKNYTRTLSHHFNVNLTDFIEEIGLKENDDLGAKIDPQGKRVLTKYWLGSKTQLLQIFINREIINEYVLATFKYGVPDKDRGTIVDVNQINGTITKTSNTYAETLARNDIQTKGQARIIVDPAVFRDPSKVQVFTHSSTNPNYQVDRFKFQKALVEQMKGR